MSTQTAETMTVLVIDRSNGYNGVSRKVTISAYCPTCGERRGEPQIGTHWDDGASLPRHTWTNPCGHVDSYAAVIGESVEAQVGDKAAKVVSDFAEIECGSDACDGTCDRYRWTKALDLNGVTDPTAWDIQTLTDATSYGESRWRAARAVLDMHGVR